jgi:hypothetical protein
MSFDPRKRVAAMLKAQSGDVPAGCYEFAIFQWRFHGIKEDLYCDQSLLLKRSQHILAACLKRQLTSLPKIKKKSIMLRGTH